MLSSKKQIIYILLFLFLFLNMNSLCFSSSESMAATSYTKIKYNKKTYKNKSKKLSVAYGSKTVSKKSYKAMVINKSYMAPVYDVFKKGIKVKYTYNKKTKKITLKHNAQTVVMYVNKKTAYVNGKKTKAPTAPLSVQYVSKKKTKIMVPVNFVAKNLKLAYSKTSTKIVLKKPLRLQYDNNTYYYTGAQGAIYYNHKKYNLSTVPVVKINSVMYFPAQEVLQNILKLDYTYDTKTGKYAVKNEHLNITLEGTLNSNVITYNGKEYKLSQPARYIKNLNNNKEDLCLPASAIFNYLGYTRSWNKTNKYYVVQSKNFFAWETELTEKMKSDTENNYIHKIKSGFSEIGKTGTITFEIHGSVSDIMKSADIIRNNKLITVTIPKSKYALDNNNFSNFGEIISSMNVKEDSNNLIFYFECTEIADFSYVIQDRILTLNIMNAYSSSSTLATGHSLTIKKPAGVTISSVTNEDLYASKKFKIIIKGNYADFYINNPIILNNNAIKDISVANSGTNTVITVSTSSLQGYKIYEEGNNIVVDVGKPRDIYKNIVVLDAGHGGTDPGAQNKSTNEKDLTFKILYTLMKGYFSQNAPDIKVYWTRTTDTYVSLDNRAKFAKSVGADAFISLHMNSSTNKSANGTEVYYSVSNNSKSFSGITSQAMANMFRTQLINDLNTKNRGTKTAGYYVIKNNTVPAILIELAFLSGSTDYSNLKSTTFQEKAAKSIYTSIVNMFSKYPTGR